MPLIFFKKAPAASMAAADRVVPWSLVSHIVLALAIGENDLIRRDLDAMTETSSRRRHCI